MTVRGYVIVGKDGPMERMFRGAAYTGTVTVYPTEIEAQEARIQSRGQEDWKDLRIVPVSFEVEVFV